MCVRFKFYMKTCSFKNIVVIIIIIIIIFFANSCLRIIKWYFLIYIDFYYIRVKIQILLHSFIQQKVEQKGLTKVFTSLDLPSTPDLIVIPPRSWNYASAVKDKTNQLFTGMQTTYNFLDLQTEILPCLSFGPTNHIYMYCPHVD